MEPQNAWSNLAYLLAGLLVFFRNLDWKRVFGLAFGTSLIALSLFSGLYHAQPVSDSYRHMDVATIYWVLPLLLLYGLFGIGWRRNTVIGCAIFWVLFGTTIAFGADSTKLTAILIAALLAETGFVLFRMKLLHPLDDLDKLAYTCGLGILLVASLVFRLFDGKGDFMGIGKFGCLEHSPLQFHALWHVFSAATLLVGYNLFSRAFDDEGTIIPDLNEGRGGA